MVSKSLAKTLTDNDDTLISFPPKGSILDRTFTDALPVDANASSAPLAEASQDPKDSGDYESIGSDSTDGRQLSEAERSQFKRNPLTSLTKPTSQESLGELLAYKLPDRRRSLGSSGLSLTRPDNTGVMNTPPTHPAGHGPPAPPPLPPVRRAQSMYAPRLETNVGPSGDRLYSRPGVLTPGTTPLPPGPPAPPRRRWSASNLTEKRRNAPYVPNTTGQVVRSSVGAPSAIYVEQFPEVEDLDENSKPSDGAFFV